MSACRFFFFFFFFHPISFPRATLVLPLPPSSNPDPGSHSGPSSLLPPPPDTARAFIFLAEIILHFLASSTRWGVELLCVLYNSLVRYKYIHLTQIPGARACLLFFLCPRALFFCGWDCRDGQYSQQCSCYVCAMNGYRSVLVCDQRAGWTRSLPL